MIEINIINLISLIISCLTLIGGIIGYILHDRKLKLQEKRLNELQIKQFEKEEAKEKMADIKANIFKAGKGRANIRFVNTGKSDAYDVKINILTPESELQTIIRFNSKWGPYDLINPQSFREEKIALCEGHPSTLKLNITWNDKSNINRTIILDVPIP